MSKLTIEHLKTLRESEDKVEFKRAAQGYFAYDGGSKPNPKDRRKCILGYVTALCNEGGGYLVLGMEDAYPHQVVGTKQNKGAIGELKAIFIEIHQSARVFMNSMKMKLRRKDVY